jgi:dolichol-phosphate mannosyltransferase
MVSLVMPLYNEEQLVPSLHAAVVDALDRLDEPWEVVYVNDGSRDRTLELLLERQREDPRVTVVELSRNWGHNAAITAGLQVARGDAIAMMDGDLQDPPTVVLDMVAEWRKGAQVVVARRLKRHEKGIKRRLYPVFYKVLGMLADFPIPLGVGICGLVDRQALNEINRLEEGNRYLPGLRAWVGFKNAVVWYERPDRTAGETKYTWPKLFRYALDAIFSFSYKPLRISLVLGCFTALFALLYGLLLLTFHWNHVPLLGFQVSTDFLVTIFSVLFLGGLQLFAVGILGEYIGRIYDEVRRRPLYIIRQLHRQEVGAIPETVDSLREAA